VSEFDLMRNVALGQYMPTGSALHRLDPRAKLGMVILLLVGVTATGSLLGLIVALGCTLLGYRAARVSFRFGLRGFLAAAPFVLLLALLQVLTIPQNDVGRVLLQWWRLVVTVVDLRSAAFVVLRFFALYMGLTLFSMTTSTVELAHGIEHLLRPLQRVGLPAHELSLTVVIALRFVPLLALEAERIAKAQASRGAEMGGGGRLLQRVRRVLPLLVPLFVTALRRAETLALAMQVRCYTGGRGRTHLIHLRAGWNDALAVAGLLLLTAGLLFAGWADVDVWVWGWMFG